MEYVRTAAPVMVQLFGPEDAGYLLHRTGKLIGMQFFPEIASAFPGRAYPLEAADFSALLCEMLAAQDDPSAVTGQGGAFAVAQQGWRLMADVADYHPASAQVLVGLVEGLAAASGRNVSVSPILPPDGTAAGAFVWTIRGR
jgi:hypothetical protein